MDKVENIKEKDMDILFDLIKHIENMILNSVEETPSGDLSYIDPIDNREISAHYAMTHLASGMLTMASKTDDTTLYDTGIKLVKKVLRTYEQDVKSSDYHYDFNNFALCRIADTLIDKEPELAGCIRDVVISAPDSPHDTINWLPMRMYVNMKRGRWTNNVKYIMKADALERKLSGAIHEDGFIDDLLPKGQSFNLQYDISTVASLVLYAQEFPTKIDIAPMIGALIAVICPDGDINYMGRGTNQIFAWGPWMYILSALADRSYTDKALDFLSERAKVAVSNGNIFLNSRKGGEKYMWWDYHYSSVYTAHLYMWLVLAYCGCEKSISPVFKRSGASGVGVLRNERFFISTFRGRTGYFSEFGPTVSALSVDGDVLYKGGFGPWQGNFGNKYVHFDSTIHNYFGILKVSTDKKENRFLRRFGFGSTNKYIKLTPNFSKIGVKLGTDFIEIEWKSKRKISGVMNLPILSGTDFSSDRLTLTCDGVNVELTKTGAVYAQYDESIIFSSRKMSAKSWKLTIK